MSIQRLIVLGIGNYTHPLTRHSVGLLLLDLIATHYGTPQWHYDRKFSAHIVNVPSPNLILAKSRVLMNISGEVAKSLLRVNPNSTLVVIHDDLERDFGKVSTKLGGSANGHNGIKSILSVTRKPFYRIRVGIGRPDERSTPLVTKHVLGPLLRNELDSLHGPILQEVLQHLSKLIKV